MRYSFVLLAMGIGAFAADTVVTFEPAKSQVHWTLGTTFHTVHGTFQLKSGTIQFDPATGKASGQIVVSAASGESGDGSRDKKMHSTVLESVRFPEVVFTPDLVKGKVAAEGKSTIDVHGNFQLHGQGHEFTMPVEVEMKNGVANTTSKFTIPFLKWGLKNPSILVARVNEAVDVEIQATARVTNGN